MHYLESSSIIPCRELSLLLLFWSGLVQVEQFIAFSRNCPASSSLFLYTATIEPAKGSEHDSSHSEGTVASASDDSPLGMSLSMG
jgi:hypothetical protein